MSEIPERDGIVVLLRIPFVQLLLDQCSLGFQHLENHSLVLVQLRDRLLPHLLSSRKNRLLNDPHRDRQQPILSRFPCGHPEGRDRGTGVAFGEAGDTCEHVSTDDVAPETFPSPALKNVSDRVVVVLPERNPEPDRHPRMNPIFEPGKEVDLPIGDRDPRDPTDLVEVVEDLGLGELVDFVEDHDARAVELLVDRFRQLTIRGVPGDRGVDQILSETHQDGVLGVVLPAVDVGVGDFEHLFSELTDGCPCDGRLPDTGGTEQKAVLGLLSLLDRRESGRHLVHVRVPTDDFAGQMVVIKHRPVTYHITNRDMDVA